MIVGVVGSGPNLKLGDVQKIYDQCDFLISANSSYLIAPDLFGYVYAGDKAWFDKYYCDVPSHIKKVSSSISAVSKYKDIEHFQSDHCKFSSGGRAIEYAIAKGAKKVLLLGLECNISKGTHFFGNHEGLNNPTPLSIKFWLEHFDRIAKQNPNIEIINYSRNTSITCFKRAEL